jgi:DNA-binding transcriptional LysR family regulator
MIQDWDKLRIFHAVARSGSFTHAGAELNLSQSAVSRQIGELERQLDVSLFQRHARGLVLTEQGEVLQRAVRDMFLRIRNTETQISDSGENPGGPLCITTTLAIGAMWLAPLMPEFHRLYPDITPSLILNDGELDLSLREADVAIRMLPPRLGGNLMRRHLMYINIRPYAHRGYLEEHGRPQSLADLASHDLLGFPQAATAPVENVNWLLEAGMPAGETRRPVLLVNSYQALLSLALNRMGIACLPEYLAQPHAELEAVLPDEKTPRVEVFFLYTEESRNSAKVAAFRDYLLGKVSAV